MLCFKIQDINKDLLQMPAESSRHEDYICDVNVIVSLISVELRYCTGGETLSEKEIESCLTNIGKMSQYKLSYTRSSVSLRLFQICKKTFL